MNYFVEYLINLKHDIDILLRNCDDENFNRILRKKNAFLMNPTKCNYTELRNELYNNICLSMQNIDSLYKAVMVNMMVAIDYNGCLNDDGYDVDANDFPLEPEDGSVIPSKKFYCKRR